MEEENKELAARIAPKPKPKFDPTTGKWVVKNWNNTVSGVPGGDKRSFDDLGNTSSSTASNAAARGTITANNTAQPMETDTAFATNTGPAAPLTITQPPFAKINAVSPLSPAAEAGLKEGDLVVEFGEINHTNHSNLRALMDVVASAATDSREIPIVLLRNQLGVRVGLVPKPWSGRGLIGCHILPYQAAE